MNIEDRSDQPPSDDDVEEAIRTVTKYRVNMNFLMANPELGVQLGNIARCLDQLKRLRGQAR